MAMAWLYVAVIWLCGPYSHRRSRNIWLRWIRWVWPLGELAKLVKLMRTTTQIMSVAQCKQSRTDRLHRQFGQPAGDVLSSPCYNWFLVALFPTVTEVLDRWMIDGEVLGNTWPMMVVIKSTRLSCWLPLRTLC
jgi:hypothetical protein